MHPRPAERQPAHAVQRAVVRAAPVVVAAPPSASQALQRKLGNTGLSAMVARQEQRVGRVAANPSAAPMVARSPAQALVVSSPSDPAEREAEAVAKRVMSMRAEADEPPRSSHRTAPARPAALAIATADGLTTAKPAVGNRTIQRGTKAAAGEGNPQPGPATQAALGRSGLGNPLPPSMRRFMERAFGADLSGVRLHTDTLAAGAAQELDAKAFTHGRDVFFGANCYQPHTPEGRQLLAHELAHTIQQSPTAPQPSPTPSVSPENDPTERAAAQAGAERAAATGESARALLGAGSLGSGSLLQRQPTVGSGSGARTGTPPTASAAPPAAAATSAHVNLVPPDWVREPGSADLLVVRSADRMIALPAQGAMVLLHPPVGQTIPDVPFFTVPTIAKEGLVAVSLGGRDGFAIDAGGQPAVVFPAALAEIQRSLAINNLRGIVVTHIHKDHVQSFLTIVRSNNIRPENIHFPVAFAVNPAASPRAFAQAMAELRSTTDATLRALGHGPSAAYGAIRTPTGAPVFHSVLEERDVTLDFYGLTAEFQQLQASRAAGRTPSGGPAAPAPDPDTASLLTRVTHRPTGFRILYVGDLRGSDLTLFRQAMGEAAYGEMLSGVRVIQGLQHHLGALESPADRTGLVELLKATYLKSGEVTVVAQSQERVVRRQFLNRSLIEALNQAGIDVHVALEPGPRGQVGTITVDTSGAVTASGGGTIESHPGAPQVREQVQRLLKLREAEEILTKYEHFLPGPARQSRVMTASRERFQRMLENYLETTIGNVQRGAAGRAQPALRDPAVQTSALQGVQASYPLRGEDRLTPATMETLRELNRKAPYLVTWERELAKARETGRVSEAGLEALWELEPEMAKQLVQSSGLSPRQQRSTLGSLPGQPASVGSRVVGTAMLAITLFNEVAPLIAEHRRASREEHVGRQLGNIIWWQSKGVYPNMEGVNDRWFRSNDWTTDSAEIYELLDSGDLDWLSLTGIDDSQWDIFAVWASTRLQNLRDWDTYIVQSDVEGEKDAHYRSLRITGKLSDNSLRFEYRVTRISGKTVGFDLDEEWRFSQRLNTILRAAASHIAEVSKKQIASAPTQLGSQVRSGAGPLGASRPLFADKPQPTSRKRFRHGLSDPALYTVFKQQSRTFERDAVFYVFPNSVSPEQPVPDGYVIVGGADYNTYVGIYYKPNLILKRLGPEHYGGTLWQTVYPNWYEVLLAKEADLEDVR
jgi:hypothetical protein